MGILLPPISQVTNHTRINQTQHHRNRSLDSALQRIPEVEVPSPNAESETTFCNSAILGSNMCSKIAITAANMTAALTTNSAVTLTAPAIMSQTLAEEQDAALAASEQQQQQQPLTQAHYRRQHERHASVTVEPWSLSVPPGAKPGTSLRSVTTPAPEIAAANAAIGSNNNTSNNGNKKKREDLTSCGSDDSGICGSDSDQLSLNRVRHSHESLDSGDMEAEEDRIDMLETTSLDEEYNLLQSDLCFYGPSSETDCRTLRPSRKQKRHDKEQQERAQHEAKTPPAAAPAAPELDDKTRYRVLNMSQAAISAERRSTVTDSNSIDADVDTVDAGPTPTNLTPTTLPPLITSTSTTATSSSSTTTPTPTETTPKTDQVLFKNFFGATKNAIFRTAQSIIENHEKKNAAKLKTTSTSEQQDSAETPACATIQPEQQVKSPTDISKKKEFFSLLTSNSSKKAAAAAAAAAAATSGTEVKSPVSERTLNLRLPGKLTDATTTTHSTAAAAKSDRTLNKIKVPGVVKYLINDRPTVPQSSSNSAETKTEIKTSSSGLLRFFESPVFNIHFAVHYLFYSKEPGVLSFIGNKIFSFPDQEVDLYIPQLIVMYIQMDELAEVLDPYLTIRCRKSVDFSLKCLWLLEAYNYQLDTIGNANSNGRKSKLALMKELFSKKEHKQTEAAAYTLAKKTHHRSQSDATVLLTESSRAPHTLSIANRMYQQPPYTTQTLPALPAKLCLGDLTSGRAFDNGCICFESVRGQVNGLLGQQTVCSCGAPKTAPQKEFMRALINVGKNLTTLPSKAEKTSALRMFLNLINKNLPARVWLPLYSDIPHHVVRITEEKTAVLNSKDKTPYIIYVEVVEVPDIYSSPVITKMMPSLRHTKSVEHLDGACCAQVNHANCSRTSSCSSQHSSGRSKRKPTAESSANCSCSIAQRMEDDVWSQEDDDITAQYLRMHKLSERDAISQMSMDSCDSRDQGLPVVFNIGEVRTRHCNNLTCENTKSFCNDPEDPSAAALKEPWHQKVKQIRESSPYGHLTNWRLMSAIVKCGDDLRQELMATQLLQMFKIIWQEENVDLWVRPYKIVCLSNDSGLIEPILNTVSLHQIKKNSSKSLRDYFIDEYGAPTEEAFCRAQKNFVQSCAAYCLISYLLQVKDRHNGNILLHSDGHIIHIDFGFILSISPRNLGFEQSPFKLTPEFVDVMGGTGSEHWKEFNRLLLIGMMSARKHMDRIINFVEIMRSNAQLPCFKNGCSGSVQNLRKRFHMNLTEQEMERKVEQLVQDSLKSLSTKLYDGYQYYTNGIL